MAKSDRSEDCRQVRIQHRRRPREIGRPRAGSAVLGTRRGGRGRRALTASGQLFWLRTWCVRVALPTPHPVLDLGKGNSHPRRVKAPKPLRGDQELLGLFRGHLPRLVENVIHGWSIPLECHTSKECKIRIRVAARSGIGRDSVAAKWLDALARSGALARLAHCGTQGRAKRLAPSRLTPVTWRSEVIWRHDT